MADDLSNDPEIQVDAGTREDIAGDVRASIAELGEKLANDAPVNKTVEQKADRLRDESGKFVKADKVEAPVEAAPKQFTDADQLGEKPAQPSTAGGPPTSWSADAKATWSTLPPAVQAAAIKRDAEINDAGRQWSEQRQTYEQVLAPVQSLSNQYQMPAADVVARLVSVEQRLGDARQAPQVIAELAQAYGVDLTALVNGSPQPERQQAAPQFDPNVIPQLINQSLSQALAERDQQSALQRQIDTFKTTPGHEHFDSVKVLMGNLLKTEQAQDMQEAYDMAIRAKGMYVPAPAPAANPALKAKKAAVSLNGSPRGQAPVNRQQTNGSVIDDVRAAFEQHAG